MTSERRASERAAARAPRGPHPARARAFPARVTVLSLLALGACRQTVVLDPDEAAEAGVGDAAAPSVDGPEARMGAGGNGGMTGGHFDGGRLDLPGFCLGGQLQHVDAAMRVPDVIVSVDRSAAMQVPFGSATRLQVIQQQLRAFIPKYHIVKWGYEEFPAATSTCMNGQGCCGGDVVLPTPNNFRAIDHAMSACDNGGPGCLQAQRPTGDALSKIHDAYENLYSPGDVGHRYVLLLTSSDPTCQGADPTLTPCDAAVNGVTKLSNNYINTAVFGVGDDAVGSACLDQLAQYGGLNNAMSPYYHLTRTPTDLSSSLESVIETIAEEACKIDIRTPPTDASEVKVLFDGIPIPTDAVDGWTYDPDTNLTLTIHGSSCRALIQNTHQVEVVTGCPTGLHN